MHAPLRSVAALCFWWLPAVGCSTVIGLDKNYADLAAVSAGGNTNGSAGALAGLAGSLAAGGAPAGFAGAEASASSAGAGAGATAAGGQGAAAAGGQVAAGGQAATAGASTAGGGSAATCAGTPSGGICWYLGDLGRSCSSTCTNHGGDAPNAASFVGIGTQGGSLAKCAAILTALSLSATPIEATRSDGMGIGCHSYGAKNYWLASPSYKPSATVASARIVCGCLE